ncbi:hypothetical protein EAE96_005797 [Botrytis aclada]|nr:hypothetical protein EAE96_005797 [Botrytis aclada]
MSSHAQFLSRYRHIFRHTHKILTSFSLVLSLNSTYQVCARKKLTKKNEEEIGNMSRTIDLMKQHMYGTALGPGLYGASGVKEVTFFKMIGHEREKDGEEEEKGGSGNMGRRETTWQERMSELSLGARVRKNEQGERGKKSEQEDDGSGPITIKIADASSKVSDGSENAKSQSGGQENRKMGKEDRGSEASGNVESVE